MIYLGTAILAFGQSFSRGNFPSYVEELGGDIVNYGLIQSVQTFSNLFVLLPAAFLADRLGHRRVLLWGIVVATFSHLIVVLSPNWKYVLIGSSGVGISRGMIMPAHLAILAHDNRNNRINVFTKNETVRWSCLSLGFLSSAVFFILFKNEFSYENLQLTMIITLIVTAAAIFPFLLLVNTDEWRNNVRSQSEVSLRRIVKTPEGKYIIGFLVISLMIGFGAGFLVPFSQPYFVTRFSLGPSEINFIMAAAQIITAMCMGFIPLLANKLSDVKVIYLTQGLSIPLTLVLAYSRILPLSVFAFIFRIALMNMSSPAQTTVLQKYVPETYRATVQSLTQTNDRIGRGFSPTISALLINETNDFSRSFTITAVMYSAAVSTLFLITRKLKGSSESEASMI